MVRRRRILLTILLIPVALYVLVAVILFYAQTSLLFPAGRTGSAEPPPGSETLGLRAPSGEKLVGLHIPPSTAADRRLLILGFAGNAWNSAAAGAYLHDRFPEAHVVAFHYRGYAPSGGAPGAAAMQQDALLVYDLARARLRPDKIVAVGLSVGSGVAPFLTAHRPVDGLILVTPFESLAALSAQHYPWLPVRRLLRHRMEPAADLHGSHVPVAIIAAERDGTVPPARTNALRAAVPHLVFDRTVAGASHNDIYERLEFKRDIRIALARVLGEASSAE
jgi:pimeloyl-ACP methyl ester carboxylesterase